MTPKISIIVPVYKAEPYISECLTSLLEQTLEDIEIITVDDKGNDKSIDIVRELKESHRKGSQIKVVEMPRNSGAAAARNAGMEIAQGEYIAFVDSDDWCEKEMYADLYEAAYMSDADWCYCSIRKDYENGSVHCLSQPEVPIGEITPQIRKRMLSFFVAYFTTGIYKRSFLKQHNISFPPYRFSEDSYFVWRVVMHARRTNNVGDPLYHYRIQPQSVSNTFNPNKSSQKVELYINLLNQFRMEGVYEEYASELDYLAIKKGLAVPLCIYAIDNRHPQKGDVKRLFDEFSQCVAQYDKNDYLVRNWKIRTLIAFFRKFPMSACRVVGLYGRCKKIVF